MVGITLQLGHCLLFKNILVWDIPYVDTSREERVSLPGSSVHGILQARILDWVAIPSSKDTGVGSYFLLQGVFLTQGSNLHLLNWQVHSLPLSQQGSPFLFLKWDSLAFEMLTSVVSCRCSMFGRVPGLYPLIASSTHSSSL